MDSILIASFDCLQWTFLLFGLSFGQQSSKSGQASQSGLTPINQYALSNILTAGANPYQAGPASDLLLRSQQPFAFPQLTGQGLFPEQQSMWDTSFQKAVQQAVGGLSGDYASRGMLTPNAIGAIAGSAAQNVAPQFAQLFAPISQQNLMAQTTLPEQVAQARNSQWLQLLDLIRGAVTGTSTSAGTSAASGFNVGILPGLGGSGGPSQTSGGAGK